MREGLIFDLDGTLWDATGVIRPVWNRVLREAGREALSEAAFAALMGKTKAEIAEKVLPDTDEHERLAVIDACFRAEQIDGSIRACARRWRRCESASGSTSYPTARPAISTRFSSSTACARSSTTGRRTASPA